MRILSVTLPLRHTDSKGAGNFFSDRDLLFLFLPLIIEQSLHVMVGLADSLMVSNVGEAAVSGVSLVDFILSLLNYLLMAIAVGGSVVIGQYIGNREEDKARLAATQLVWSIGACGLFLSAVIFLSKEFLLRGLFGQIAPDVYRHADIYLSITIFSIPFLAVYNAGATLFRNMNNTRLPMQIVALMNVINIAGNALLVFGFHLGTAGIAIPTLVSRVAAAIIITYLACNPRLQIHVKRTLCFRPDWAMIRRIMRVGIPFAMENGMFYGGRLVVLSLIATFGTASIAANAVAGTLSLFQVMPGMAVVTGMTVVISRCIGANDSRQARYYNKKIMGIVYVSHLVSCSIVILLLPLVFRIYHLSEEAMSLASQIIWWHGCLAILVWPLSYTLPTTFRASGDARYPMMASVFSMVFFRVAGAYLLGEYFGMGLFGVWMGMFIDWIVKGGLFVYRYFSGKWLEHRLV